MNCLVPEVEGLNEVDQAKRDSLQTEPLAFTSDPKLVPATSRIGVPVRLPTENHNKLQWINVEIFEQNTSASTSPLVLYVPGVCESAETLTVQSMAQWAKSIGMRLAVIELQGHGLSSGTLADMSTNLDVIVWHVLYAIKKTVSKLFQERPGSPYLLSGSSFGGTVALYAAEYMSRRKQQQQQQEEGGEDSSSASSPKQLSKLEDSILKDEELWENFFVQGTLAGVVSVTPAVGVDPEVLPPSWMVSTLSFFSSVFPAAQVPFTPREDPSQYNCPPTTTRNFDGHWPLAVSKCLLDLTSRRVPEDVANGRLTLKHIPRVVLLAGGKDLMIPMEAIEALEAQLEAPSKELVVLPKAGHDILTNSKSQSKALEKLFSSLL
jgi:pimeloyl-ACP methyl ester carboxylesterase